jgi:hypothetical protein
LVENAIGEAAETEHWLEMELRWEARMAVVEESVEGERGRESKSRKVRA